MANVNGKNENLNTQLANRTEASGDGLQAVLTRELTKSFKAIQSIVPKHVTPERLIRISLNAVSRNPKLAECAPETIVGAIINCATLGLEPNLIGHAYIVPFWNGTTKRREAQFQIGYKGAIELFRRTGEVAKIAAHEIYSKDKFKVSYGTHEEIIHEPPALGEDRGEIIGYYATYRLKDGSDGFCVMSKKEAEQHRDKFTNSKTKDGRVFGPWVDHFDEMAKKTCILKMAKYMPISIEKQENRTVLEAFGRDGASMKVKEPAVGFGEAFLDVEYTVSTGFEVDQETGEVNPPATDDFEGAMGGKE